MNPLNTLQIAVVYRSDVEELRSACEATLENAKAELLTASLTVKVNASSSSATAMQGLAAQVNASGSEALVGCLLSAEAKDLVKQLDAVQKPLKSVVFTNGPAQAVGEAILSQACPCMLRSTLLEPTPLSLLMLHPPMNLNTNCRSFWRTWARSLPTC